MGTDIKKNKKEHICPGWLYAFGVNLMYFYMKIFFNLHLETIPIRDIDGPVLVVANHQSLFDFGIVSKAALPKQLRFVISSHFFHNSVLNKFFRFIGAISKKQFVPDTVSVRKVLRQVRQGHSIAIFPEGQTCYSGENAAIDPGIGKLAKLLGIPVVNVQIRGNYLRRPKWATGKTYPSIVEAKTSLLLTKEQIAEMSAEEIGTVIISGISYDEFVWQKEKMYKSRNPRSAEGLESLLFLCPSCGSEFTIKTSGRHVTCSHCGYDVVLNDYGLFEKGDQGDLKEDTISGWMRLQSAHVKKLLDEDALLPITAHGRYLESDLGDYDEFGYHLYGEGTGTLDETGFTYTGTRAGEPYEYHADPYQMWDLTHNADLASISLNGNCVGDKDYAFDPDDPRLMMKYVLAWSLVRDRYFPNA
ncbi:MAG: 1-acyl-sn-glycerol-3-phosphate acyltransferase [Oscillospiraceae bacterium]|nr:1-acyl-sn-glycerol-3-phosphate acyltransferase [Oscillospiraceae bacterium]